MILFLAIIAMLLTCLIVAALLFYGIGHETGFPWIAALITGAILALALSLPTSLDYWWTIQSIAFARGNVFLVRAGANHAAIREAVVVCKS